MDAHTLPGVHHRVTVGTSPPPPPLCPSPHTSPIPPQPPPCPISPRHLFSSVFSLVLQWVVVSGLSSIVGRLAQGCMESYLLELTHQGQPSALIALRELVELHDAYSPPPTRIHSTAPCREREREGLCFWLCHAIRLCPGKTTAERTHQHRHTHSLVSVLQWVSVCVCVNSPVRSL